MLLKINFLINLLIASVGIGFLLMLLGFTTVGGWVMLAGAGVVWFGFNLHT